MSYITGIGTAVPDHRHSQEALLAFYQDSTDDERVKRRIRAVGSKSAIGARHSVIADFGKTPEDFEFFPKNRHLLPEPGVEHRMSWYKKHALPLSLKAVAAIEDFESRRQGITHIITVTCTGMSAPGLDMDLIFALELRPSVKRISINFMGCNAAILALKQADAICRSTPRARVLVVCTELSTIHFQKSYSEDYLLSNCLFADGSAALMVESENERGNSLEILAFDSCLLQTGYNEMAWQISATGFVINLTAYVSQLINGSIGKMLDTLDADTKSIDHWAIHPGGKKILDDFASALRLPAGALQRAYEVLHEFGNMSSATVVFVLKKILDHDLRPGKSEKVFTAAFGPGLSIETMQLQYV